MTNKEIITLLAAYGLMLAGNCSETLTFSEPTAIFKFEICKRIGKRELIKKVESWLQVHKNTLYDYMQKNEAQKLVFENRVIDKSNFFDRTNADFKQSTRPENFVEFDFISRSGSKYFYTQEGVYRYSDHWGACASCFWTFEGNILGMFDDIDNKFYRWGFVKWGDFSNGDFNA